MDLQGIMNKLLPFLPIAVLMALVMIGIGYVSYGFYRKQGGNRTVTKLQFAAAFLLLGWIVVVLALTTFSRGAHFEGWVNFRLFSGYVSAWHQWSLSEWQLIIFNMLMFAPLGFLLPLLSKKTRHFLSVFLLSLLVTVGIESFQMLTRRGIFELDDLLHNTLGSIAGYLLMRAILDSVEFRKVKVKSIGKALAIPLAFALLYSGGMLVYHTKELGNLSIVPAIPQNMDQVEVTLTTDLPTAVEPVSLYYSERIHNMSYGKRIAELMERSFDLQRKGAVRVDGPNRIWPFLDREGNEYAVIYSLNSGGWSLYTEAAITVPNNEEQLLLHKEFYENWMLSSGLLPLDAEFSAQNEDTLRWERTHSAKDIAQGDRDYVEGFIMLVPSQGHQIPQDLFFTMQENQFVRKVELISPAKAFDKIIEGEFSIYNNLENGDELFVNEYELSYTYDSKGYYQPVYKFIGSVNGQDWEAFIPAIRD